MSTSSTPGQRRLELGCGSSVRWSNSTPTGLRAGMQLPDGAEVVVALPVGVDQVVAALRRQGWPPSMLAEIEVERSWSTTRP